MLVLYALNTSFTTGFSGALHKKYHLDSKTLCYPTVTKKDVYLFCLNPLPNSFLSFSPQTTTFSFFQALKKIPLSPGSLSKLTTPGVDAFMS